MKRTQPKRKRQKRKTKKRKKLKNITRRDAICILHMSLKLIGHPITIQEIREMARKSHDALPSHIQPSSPSDECLLFWEEQNFKTFGEKILLEENFIYLFLIEPVSTALQRLSFDSFAITSCVLNQVWGLYFLLNSQFF